MMMITLIEEFCQGFFHVDQCYEWNTSEPHCLLPTPTTIQNTQKKCRTKGYVRGIVTVENKERKLVYTNKYRNFYLKELERSYHVEDLMVKDQNLLHHLSEKCTVTLYTTYQPCHHSGEQNKSCVHTLIDFYKTYLFHQQIQLIIKCCSIHRAHWDNVELFQGCDKNLEAHSNRAREGIDLLLNETDIQLSAMTQKDWDFFLERFCDPVVQKRITKDDWKHRNHLDLEIQNFLETRKQSILLSV